MKRNYARASLRGKFRDTPVYFVHLSSLQRIQNCLDTTFGMVYEKIRQKAFSRGIGGRLQTPVMGNDGPRSADGASGSEGSRGGRVAAPATDQQTPVTVGVASGPEAVTATAGAGTGVTGVVGGGMAGRAGAVGEGEERSQVKAEVAVAGLFPQHWVVDTSAFLSLYSPLIPFLSPSLYMTLALFCISAPFDTRAFSVQMTDSLCFWFRVLVFVAY